MPGIRVTECGKNLSAYPEIGMIHMSLLDSARHAQRDATKPGSCHDLVCIFE
jgi:hypothetical protein